MSRLRIHVWGPAFGLPSIESESLATITYLRTLPPVVEWELIASSPSAVPTQTLPALFDPASSQWVYGLDQIASHISAHHAAPSSRPLSPSREADLAAYTSFLATQALPLLSLSLFASSSNWAAATRPAYTSILPFPLGYTEPPAIRNAMVARAAHLGFAGLDAEREEADESANSFLRIPESLIKRKESVMNSMSPEARARIRLEEEAKGVLEVLAELEGLYGEQSEMGLLECRVFGYLALMYVPILPRSWLRDVMTKRYPRLCNFVERVRAALFHDKTLPWTPRNAGSSTVQVASRFGQGAVRSIPNFGEDLYLWMARVRKDGFTRWDLATAVCSALATTAIVFGVVAWRRLPPFGSPLHRWEKVRTGFLGLGAAGSMFEFGGFGSPVDTGAAPRGFTGGPSGGLSSEFEDVSVEAGGRPPVAEIVVDVKKDT